MSPLLRILLLSLLFTCGPTPAQESVQPPAQPVDLSTLQQALDRQSSELEQAKAELETARQAWEKEAAELAGQPLSQAMESEAQLAVESAQVRLETVELDRAALAKRLALLKEAIQKREAPSVASVAPDATAQAAPPAIPLELMRSAATILEKHIAVLVARKQVAAAVLELAQTRYQELRDRRVQQALQTEREAFADREARLDREYNQAQDRLKALRAEFAKLNPEEAQAPAGQEQAARIRGLEERVYLAQMRLTSARQAHQLDNIRTQMELALGSENLKTLQAQFKAMQGEVEAAIRLQERKVKLFQQQLDLLRKRAQMESLPSAPVAEEEKTLNELIQGYDRQRKSDQEMMAAIGERLAAIDGRLTEVVRADLTSRHKLPWELAAWEAILHEVFDLPAKVQETWSRIREEARLTVAAMDPARWGVLALFSLFWGLLWRSLSRLAARKSFRTTGVGVGDSFSARALGGLAAWWQENRLGLLLSGLVLVWFEGGVGGGIAALALLAVGVWFWVAAATGLTYLLIDSSLVPEAARQPHLSRMLRVHATLGGLLGALLLLGRGGLLSVTLTDLVDRLFMLFLLLPGLVLLGARGEVLNFFTAHIRARYWLEAVRLSSIAVPLAILAAALLGVAGYLNLAWLVGRHLAWFLLVMALWLIARGLLLDLGSQLKKVAETRSEYGPMWAQVAIDPLVNLLRIALFIGAVAVLLGIYGWTRDSDVGEAFNTWLQSPLISREGFKLAYQQLILGLLFLAAVFWLGARIRVFGHRWLYQNILDAGIRNSLSVFTQYAFVLFGVLLGLNLLGFDLTSLAVFAGALGVGIGFGLQHIVNNFISGIILLAERPLRTGDWVTVAAAEGEVTNIGIRAVTVTTWDRQDVIIPNSDLVSNPFTNWTRSDNVVRTKIPVGISYESDLRKAKEVMLTVLRRHPDILDDPAPTVWANGFSDSSVDFTLVYYIDVKRVSRVEIRTEIILRIWEELRRHDVSIPYQHQDIYIKEFPGRRRAAE